MGANDLGLVSCAVTFFEDSEACFKAVALLRSSGWLFATFSMLPVLFGISSFIAVDMFFSLCSFFIFIFIFLRLFLCFFFSFFCLFLSYRDSSEELEDESADSEDENGELDLISQALYFFLSFFFFSLFLLCLEFSDEEEDESVDSEEEVDELELVSRTFLWGLYFLLFRSTEYLDFFSLAWFCVFSFLFFSGVGDDDVDEQL